MNKKKRKHSSYKYTFIIVFVLLFISSGYSLLNSGFDINGKVKIAISSFKIHLFGENTTFNPNNNVAYINYGESISIEFVPDEGRIVDSVECTNGYSTGDYDVGIESYGKSQTVDIYNNEVDGDSQCYFKSRYVKSQESDYDKEHYEFSTVKEALDYLYDALGYDHVTLDSLIILYDHEDHPEIHTVKEALDYLYNRLIG